MSVGSRLLPLVLATAALAAGAVGLGGLALWLGLLTVPAAAAAAFVAVSDALEGLRPGLLRAWTSGLALALIVLASAARENTATGAATSRLATWALVFALLSYLVPAVAWVLQPVRVPRRTQRRRRLRPAEVDELLSRAA
jgi:hypothetical protein